MKNKIIIIIALLGLGKNVFSQNTFPATGNAGIGTTSPTGNLHIKSDIANQLILQRATAGPLFSGIAFLGYNSVEIGSLKLDQASGEHRWYSTGSYFPTIYSNGVEVVRITSAGNFGIGTTTPQSKLDVNGDIRALNLRLNGVSNGITATCVATHLYNSCGSLGFITMGFTQTSGANTGTPDPFTIQQSNNAVGIRTNTPTQALDVNGNIKTVGFILTTGAAAGKVLTSDATGNATWQTASGGGGSWTVTGVDMSNTNTGGVMIGTSTLPAVDAKLAVKGNIYAQKIKITQTGWADYVFESNYSLLPITEVERFINKNKHLPDMPAADEVSKNGVDLGDNQINLLKKIEELTLYIIQQNKKMMEQDQKLELLQKEVEQLKKNR